MTGPGNGGAEAFLSQGVLTLSHGISEKRPQGPGWEAEGMAAVAWAVWLAWTPALLSGRLQRLGMLEKEVEGQLGRVVGLGAHGRPSQS